MITVFGSINLDISVRTPHLPAAGETVMGCDALFSPGGKGANQAHAARRFGAPVRMFGAVGTDEFAAPALSQLTASGVDVSGVARLSQERTGLAMITVGEGGENAIVVAPGANLAVRADQVPDDVLRASRVLLLQMEVPDEQNSLLAARAKRLGCKVILNAAPLGNETGIDTSAVDVLIVNEVELNQLCSRLRIGEPVPSVRARSLARSAGIDVLVTLGKDGACFAQRDGHETHCSAISVPAVDTTGAGDTFAGVFAAALAMDNPVRRAMQAASVAAGLACTRPGAQVAQPERAEIEAWMTKHGMASA